MSDKKGSSDAPAPAAEKDYFLDKGAAKIEEEERQNKKQKDYMADVQAAIPGILASVPASPSSAELNSALVSLLAWEKKARLASDGDSTKLLADTILDLCFDKKDWRAINDQITLLCKRRAQLLKVIKAVVDKGIALLLSAPDAAAKRELIGTLRAVADGKIFLEMERAGLTMQLAQMAEAEGKIAEAADILQEVAVETIGSMELKDKAKYLLEQLRLCLDKKDFLRAELVAKKIKTKQFSEAGWADIKIKYFELMIRFYSNSKEYLQVARAYKAVFDTLVKQIADADAAKKAESSSASASASSSSIASASAGASAAAGTGAGKAMSDAVTAEIDEDEDDGGLTSADPLVARSYEALQNVIVFAALAPFDGESREILTRIQLEKKRLARVPAFAAVASQLLGAGLCPWPLKATAAGGADLNADAVWRAHSAFATSSSMTDDASVAAVTSAAAAAAGESRWDVLHTRVVQHNIRVASKAYSRVTLARLAKLLALDEAATEKNLCDLVAAKQLFARIDRPRGVVSFEKTQAPAQVLNQWGRDVEQLLDLLETTSHLIQKETMVHALKQQQQAGKAK